MDMLTIQAHSLLNFDFYRFNDKKPKAIMVQLYHSGTVCTEGEALNFKLFANYCKACGVPVVLAPVMSRAGVYASRQTSKNSSFTAKT